MSDIKDNSGDSRLKKASADATRGDRAASDMGRTDTDGTAFTGTQRRANFRDEWTANALPTPPSIDGFHLCWLSTTNNFDPIHKRIRMGYEPVRAAEVPGFEHYKMKSGEYEGIVSCNEMLLFKIPMDLYQEMMSYFHHEKPLAEEEMLKNSDLLADGQAREVASSYEENGFKQLAQKRAPVFN